MKITLPEQHVVLASHLDFGSVLGVEEHSIFWLDRPDIGSYRNHLAPSEPAPNCDCCRNQDSPAAAPLAWLVVGRHQHSIMEHADRQPTLVQTAGSVAAAAQVGHQSVTLPASHDGADDQQESDDPGDGGSHDRDATGA
jgi:hypothetical protein